MCHCHLYAQSNKLKRKKKFLVIGCGGLPDKLYGASSIVFFQYLEYLLKKGNEVTFLSVTTKKLTNKEKNNFYKNFTKKKNIFLINQRSKKLYNFNKFNFLFKKIQTVNLDFSISKYLVNRSFDKILALDIAAASFAKKLDKNLFFVWLGDLNFSTIWYHFYYDYRKTFRYFFYYIFIKIFTTKWKNFYKNVLDNTKIISGSNVNIKELKKIGIVSKYIPYPWPKVYKQNILVQKKKPSFIFFGNLIGLGSKSAINYLLGHIYPIYIDIWGEDGFVIYVCGAFILSNEFKIKIKESKNIVLMGYVEDINALASKCHGCIFPIDVPVGNRSRIVTAMGSRWPIIAHKNVSIGNPALISGSNCFLAKTPKDFGKFSRLIFNNKKLRNKLTLNAYNTYKSTFEPAKALSEFGKFINV